MASTGQAPARAMEAGTAPLKPVAASGQAAASGTSSTMAFVVFIKGNFTPWWFLGTIFVLYFLISLGMPRIATDGAVMATHIPFAFLFVVACAWNLFHTPSHGPLYRRLHKIVGWSALIIGFCSVVTGYMYILGGGSQADLGTKILMMAIGLMQLVLQLLGLWYVRGYKWIHMHSSMMTYMFYMSGVLIAISARCKAGPASQAARCHLRPSTAPPPRLQPPYRRHNRIVRDSTRHLRITSFMADAAHATCVSFHLICCACDLS